MYVEMQKMVAYSNRNFFFFGGGEYPQTPRIIVSPPLLKPKLRPAPKAGSMVDKTRRSGIIANIFL